jgi:hypothetical protein
VGRRWWDRALAEREAAANPLWLSAHIRILLVPHGLLGFSPLYASAALR